MTAEEEKEVIRVCGKDYDGLDIPAYIRKREFEEEQKLADATKYGETIENQKKIIEMWDEDRGWVSSCGNCGKSLSPDSVEKGKICPFCYVEWKGKIRV